MLEEIEKIKEEIKKIKEDIEQYSKAFEDFYDLDSTDYMTAYELAKVFFQIANRWSEIKLNSDKMCNELGYKKTLFKEYAYEKYRLASNASEFCRVVYRQGKEDLRSPFLNEE